MTLPSSVTLDFNSIRAEFAGPSSNVTLSTYIRGSAYTYPVPANANITTGSTSSISVSNFYGAKGTARLSKFTASQGSSGGKLPTTYRGAPDSAAFSDASGYWGPGNIGSWTAFRTETNVGVNAGLATWTTAIPVGVAAVARVYNTSGTEVASANKSNTHGVGTANTQNPAGANVRWRTGLAGTDTAGFTQPAANQWPTSGVHYIDGG